LLHRLAFLPPWPSIIPSPPRNNLSPSILFCHDGVCFISSFQWKNLQSYSTYSNFGPFPHSNPYPRWFTSQSRNRFNLQCWIK
jgi:hypothetical protein